MSVGQITIFSRYVLGFIGGMFLLPCVDTTAYFTQFPPNVSYVSSGGTARFVWDYHVDNRLWEFKSESPVWYFINQATHSESIIGADDRYTNNWSFVIKRATCPPLLMNPDRVSRESKATLVITDVTTADNGIYKCSLQPKTGTINHQVQLVITVSPTFLPSHPKRTYQVIEGQDLKINCTAIGPPTPSITWVNITDGSVDITSQGSGSAVLEIDNITRYHAGVYECQAKNNPNEDATTTRTSVTVYYKPTILKQLSSSKFPSWNGRQVTLKCTFNGLPTPYITWYKPSGQLITNGVTVIAKGSQVVITTKEGADYGSYKCRATNVAGSDEHVINVTQLFPPGAPNVTILDQDIQASSATVRWTKPGYDGGSPVIDYKVQINTNPPQEQNTAKTEHEFTGLTKNTRYEVRVYARNVVGYGNASIIIFTTKKQGSPPLPSLQLSKSKTTISLYWTKPDENGGTIKSYTIYQKHGVGRTWTRIHVVRDLSSLTYVIQLVDLEPGQTYWFIVTATNEFGESEIGSSDKGKKAYVLPKVTTATQSTTTAVGRESINKSDREEKCKGSKASYTVLGVITTFLILSLGFNVLQFLYLRRRLRMSSEKGVQAQKGKMASKEDATGESYENDFELEDKAASVPNTSPARQPVQTAPEYETIQQLAENAHPSEARSFNDTSNYQGLNLVQNASIQGTHGPVYEPLRTRSVEPSMQHNDNEQRPYEPLNNRNQNTTYQSLQTNSRESAI